MTPDEMARYRRETHRSVQYRWQMRKCEGECNRLRSVRQFVGDSKVCIRCAGR